MAFQRALRLDQLPPYLFVDMDRRKRAALASGHDVINLGIGDPDQPTLDFIVERMAREIRDPRWHRYPADTGAPEFREAAAAWFDWRFGVRLDPATEVLALIGTKEGLGHLPLAVVNPGDVALLPSPGYPVYRSSTIFAGGVPVEMMLREEDGWLPRLDEIPRDVLKRTRLMFLNYPNNPLGATATIDLFESAVRLAREHDFIIAHDAAYSEIYFETPPPSILQVHRAKEVAIELHSLSKTFNMTGWRLGFAAGHAEALAALAKVKSNVDSSQFTAIQMAGVEALSRISGPEVAELRETYGRRRDLFVTGLRRAGFDVRPPAATFYVWARVPPGQDSMGCVTRMLEEAHIVAIPGSGFGAGGEGYVRFSLTSPEKRLEQAVERLGRMRWN